MVVRVQIPAQLVTVSSFRNLFRHIDLHHITTSDHSLPQTSLQVDLNPLEPFSVQINVQQRNHQIDEIRPDVFTIEADQSSDCLDQIWDFLSDSTESDYEHSGRIAPEQLNRFLMTVSDVLLQRDPLLKEEIEEFFCSTMRRNYTYIDRDQFKLILSDLERWYIDLEGRLRDSNVDGEERKPFWQDICDAVRFRSQNEQAETMQTLPRVFRKNNDQDQPRYILVRRSALTRLGKGKFQPRSSKFSRSRPTKSLEQSQSAPKLVQNKQLQLEIPLVTTQFEPDRREEPVAKVAEPTQETTEQQPIDESASTEQLKTEEPELTSQDDTQLKSEKKCQSLKKTEVKARIECWNKRTRIASKDEKSPNSKPEQNDESASPPIRAACNRVPKVPQSRRAARIQPATDVLRDCILFDNNDRIVTLHRKDAVLLDKASRTNSNPEEPDVCKMAEHKRKASINIIDHSIVLEDKQPKMKETSNFIKTRPYIPRSIRRRRPSSASLSWSSTSQLAVFDKDDDFELKEFDPLNENPDGWLIVSEQGNERQKGGGQKHQSQRQERKLQIKQQQQDREQQQHQQQRPHDQQDRPHDAPPNSQTQTNRRESIQAEKRHPFEPHGFAKTVWKMYRGAKPRCRIRRRIRLSGWELSALLNGMGHGRYLQVDGKSL